MQISVDPINYELRYYAGRKIGANWSTTERYSDWSTFYPVVEYTNYTANIDQFIAKYPTVTIETEGGAVSESTFGDVGQGKFGSLTFETIHFNNDDYFDNKIVASYLNHFTFDVGVEIGVGFKKTGNTLYVRPFVNGWIYSVGAYWRYLNFYLKVTSITFNPK